MAIELNQIWDFPIKEFHPFPRALLGVGAHDILGVEAKNLGFERTLLVTTGLRGSGIIEELTGKIEYQGVEVVLYDKVESNPKDYNCMEAAALYQSEKCDSIISVGGGSSHDAAKGARVVIAHDGRNINEFEGFSKSTNMQNPPHIAVSTTAGTGSETSWAYVITDTSDMDNPKKWVGFDDAVVATLALDDPLLYYSCPPALHRVLRFRRARARFGAVRLAPGLRTVAGQRAVLDRARRQVPAGGDVRATQSRGAVEADARAVHRGAGVQLRRPGHRALDLARHQCLLRHPPRLNNAIALPRVWEYNLPSRYQRYAKIAEALGIDTRNMTTAQAADAAVEEAIRLSKDLGIPDNFGQIKPDTYDKNRMNTGKYKASATTSRPTRRRSAGSPSTSWATTARRATPASARSSR